MWNNRPMKTAVPTGAEPHIAVVIPCFNVEPHIVEVIRTIPSWVAAAMTRL